MAGPPATADICDAHAEKLSSGELRVLPPIFQAYGARSRFAGVVETVKLFDDNVLLRALLDASAGAGRVLLVDGGGSARCALLGGNLAALAAAKGWEGIVVVGCVRDVDEINACHVGVRALGSCPVKSGKKGGGERHVAVSVGGAVVRDGEWLCADRDGVVVAPVELSA